VGIPPPAFRYLPRVLTRIRTTRMASRRSIALAGALLLMALPGCFGGDDEKVRFSPSADAQPFGGPVPLKVKFTAKAGEIPGDESYYWCFDDGTVSQEQNPTHVFREAGYYLVEVDIEGEKPSHRASKSLYLGAWPPGLWERAQKGFRAKTIKRNVRVQQQRTQRRKRELERRERESGPSASTKRPCGQLSKFGPEPAPKEPSGATGGQGPGPKKTD
jgi:hypothetical protein